MSINAIEIRVGNVLDHEKDLWVVTKTMHVQPGKGGAFMQIEMKKLKDGTKTNVRFRSSETVIRAHLEQRSYKFSYMNGDLLECMDTQTYEQISVSKDLVGEKVIYLKDDMDLIIEFHQDKPISIRLPETAILEVSDCEPVVKGQTATSSYKPAILENGAKVAVPQFVNAGDKIIVRLEDEQYIKRAE